MVYAFTKILETPFDKAVSLVCKELSLEGFRVLTEINVELFLKEFDLEYLELGKCKIFGVCNPMYARQTSKIEEAIALILPYNIVVHERMDGRVIVAAVEPLAVLNIKNDRIKRLSVISQAGMRTVFQSL